MRMILAMGRVGIDLEMRVQPKGKAGHITDGEVEVHDISSDHELAPHIIGFVPDADEDGDD